MKGRQTGWPLSSGAPAERWGDSSGARAKTDATAGIVIPVQVLIERAARSRLEIGTERRILNEYRAASPVAAVGLMTS